MKSSFLKEFLMVLGVVGFILLVLYPLVSCTTSKYDETLEELTEDGIEFAIEKSTGIDVEVDIDRERKSIEIKREG